MKIAFGYKMGSGKDICVKYLINRYGGAKIRFAEPLYDILRYVQKRCNLEFKKDRQFLQLIGTEWGRKIDPDIWVNLALKSQPKEGNVFCADVRFKNEFEALKRDGFVLIKLVRNTINENRVGTGNSTHVSENDLDNYEDEKWDYVIDNNGSLDELYNKLDEIVNIINKNFIGNNKNE